MASNRRSKSRRRRKILGMSQELFFTIVFSLAFLAVVFAAIFIVHHGSERGRIAEEAEEMEQQMEEMYQSANDEVAKTDNYKSDTIVRLAAWGDVFSEEITDGSNIADIKSTLKDANIVFGDYDADTKELEEESTESVKIVEKREVKFAILSYEEQNFDEEKILEDIVYAKENAKIVICLMHWGSGNSVTASQEEKANFLIENGVNIIIGSSASGLQKMEMKENGEGKQCLVAYSVGAYSNKGSDAAKTGIILSLQVYITKEGEADIYKVNFTPIYQGSAKVYDIKKDIASYEAGEGNIEKYTYDTLKNALNRINGIIKG